MMPALHKKLGSDVMEHSVPSAFKREATSLGAAMKLGGAEGQAMSQDEDIVRKVAKYALEGHCYRVPLATNGQEALQLVESKPWTINLAMTDVIMPEMSGRNLAECLRKNATLRILFASGYTDGCPAAT